MSDQDPVLPGVDDDDAEAGAPVIDATGEVRPLEVDPADWVDQHQGVPDDGSDEELRP